MNQAPLAVAVAGAGYWGKNLARCFAAMPQADLVAVCDSDPDVLDRMGKLYPGISLLDSFEELLERQDIEAVAIVTPAVLHASQAIAALRAGKHVYVEKPMGLSAEEAEQVVAAARRAPGILMVGHMLVHHPAVQRIRRLLEAGELGDIYYMYAQRVNLGRLRQDENALWSLGPHDVSVMLHLTGLLPSHVAAWGRSYLQPGIEDVVFVLLSFPNGILGHIQLSWLDPRKVRRFTLVGSKKMLEFDDTHPTEKLTIFDKGFDRPPEFSSYAEYLSIRHGDIVIPKLEMREPLLVELEHFVDCALAGRTPVTDAQDGLAVTRVLEAASASLAAGGLPVSLEGTDRARTDEPCTSSS